jgi:hypothetical protein
LASGSILFILIERWLPLPIDGHWNGYWKSSLRWGVAHIMVSLPVLWCAQRVINRDVARNPVSRLTPVLLTAVENGGAGRSKMVALGCVDLP